MSERCTPMPEEEYEPCMEHGWSMEGLPDGARCIEGRLEDAEAAVQRVREVCERIRTDTYDLRPDSKPALRAHERLAVANLIRDALDGP